MGKGQLPALAAAHPEAYTALIDCYLRSPLIAALNMILATDMLAPPAAAVLGSEEQLGSSVTAAGLASALTSLVKRAVQFVTAATGMQQVAPRAVATPEFERAAAACYPAAVASLASCFLASVAVQIADAASAMSRTSSSRGSQAAARVALLAVVLACSLVQLADAMEAAGPQLMFRALRSNPTYNVMWAPGGIDHSIELGQMLPKGNQAQKGCSGSSGSWLCCKRCSRCCLVCGCWTLQPCLGMNSC
jgi:hypothetical protein